MSPSPEISSTGVDFLPYFIYGLEETGKQGIGNARVPYRLVSVADGSGADGPVIFRTLEGDRLPLDNQGHHKG